MALRNASMSVRMKQLVTEFLTVENAAPIDIHWKMKGAYGEKYTESSRIQGF
jgi:hypothetical protein